MLMNTHSRSIKEHILKGIKLEETEHSSYNKASFSNLHQKDDSFLLQRSKTSILSKNKFILPTNNSSPVDKLLSVSQRTYQKIKELEMSKNTNGSQVFAPSSNQTCVRSGIAFPVKLKKEAFVDTVHSSRYRWTANKVNRNRVKNQEIHNFNCHAPHCFNNQGNNHCISFTSHPTNHIQSCKSSPTKRSPVSKTSKYFVCLPTPKSVPLPPSLIENLKKKSRSMFFSRDLALNSYSKKDSKNCNSKLLTDTVLQFHNGNHLGNRLSLIHCYGNDYEKIARQQKLQLEREKTSARLESKRAARIRDERLKMEQRKKIYALNRLMTELEKEKFEEFMNKFSANNVLL